MTKSIPGPKRLLKRLYYEHGGVSLFRYDENQRLTGEIYRNPMEEKISRFILKYDLSGRPCLFEQFDGDNLYKRTEYTYEGQIVNACSRHAEDGGRITSRETLILNKQGLLIQKESGIQNIIKYEYDDAGNLIRLHQSLYGHKQKIIREDYTYDYSNKSPMIHCTTPAWWFISETGNFMGNLHPLLTRNIKEVAGTEYTCKYDNMGFLTERSFTDTEGITHFHRYEYEEI